MTLALSVAASASDTATAISSAVPKWLYPSDSARPKKPDDPSACSASGRQLRDLCGEPAQGFVSVPYWRLQAHTPMPSVVAHGRKPDVFACGYCHTANGQGRPENASIAGLPASYIARQLEDFYAGLGIEAAPITYLVNGCNTCQSSSLRE